MRVCICGPRDYYNYDVLCDAIEASGFDITEVVSGGADGVDKMGERWAKENGRKLKIFPAEWDNFKLPGCIIKVRPHDKKRYNSTAGFHRNGQMADYGEAVIAIITGSHGTADMVKKAKLAGLKVFEYEPDNHTKEADYGYVF